MFGRLFARECRMLAKSLVFWLFVGLLAVFLYSQIGDGDYAGDRFPKPDPAAGDYGDKVGENPATIVPGALEQLRREAGANSYVCYPIGFYRQVRLDEAGQAKIAALWTELTGRELAANSAPGGNSAPSIQIQGGDGAQASQSPDGSVTWQMEGGIEVQDPTGNLETPSGGAPDGLPAGEETPGCIVSYERFVELMGQVDAVLGGGSSYAADSLIAQFGRLPKTYEDALAEYEHFHFDDRISGAYARLFSDYAGIMLGVLPVFVAVALCLRDRRARMQELIYSRRAASGVIIGARFCALTAMCFAPVVLLSLLPMLAVGTAWGFGSIDPLAPLLYDFAGLLPTLLVPIAVGMLLTELTGTPLAILVQAAWWFLTIFSTGIRLTGGCGAGYILRHNSLGEYETFWAGLPVILANRAAWTLAALGLAALTVLVYDGKRRGKLDAGGIFAPLRRHISRKRQALPVD